MRFKSGERARVRTTGTPKRRHYVRSLTRGAVAVTMACTIVGVTLAAAGHVLALAIDARSDARTLVGRAQSHGGLAWFSEPDNTMVPRIVKAVTSLSAGALPTEGSRLTLIAAAGSINDDDVIFTGSIGGGSGNFVARSMPPAIRLEDPVKAAIVFPIPRARPQLASLTPDFNLKMEENVQPAKTAVYDILARTVYLPNGEKLEAHSGLGEFMDNPRHVRLRMRGVTPPNTYKLTMREALFHGVEAIRLNPEDRDAMFGRDGILAHSYMLGPNGQSNGCVSIKDYPRFLAAFKRGEIERLVVVFKLEKPPTFFAKGSIIRAAKLF